MINDRRLQQKITEQGVYSLKHLQLLGNKLLDG